MCVCVRVCLRVCVCVYVCLSSLVCMVGVIFVYTDTVFGFYGYSFLYDGCFSIPGNCLDTCCFECLICMCFVFLYLHLFSAVEHVSHGKALWKYAHYYYSSSLSLRIAIQMHQALRAALSPFPCCVYSSTFIWEEIQRPPTATLQGCLQERHEST